MTRPLLTTPPVTGVARAAATVSAAAAVAFALLLGGLHLVQPELDPTWRFLSEYALGRAGWMMTAAFVALAISLLGAVVALTRQVRTWPGRIGLALLIIAATGILLAAVFPTDPITVPVEAQTTAGRLHNLGASLDWSPVGMLLLAWSLGRTTTWRSWRPWLLLAAAIPCVLTLAFTAARRRRGWAVRSRHLRRPGRPADAGVLPGLVRHRRRRGAPCPTRSRVGGPPAHRGRRSTALDSTG